MFSNPFNRGPAAAVGGVSAREAHEMHESGEAVIVDVRESHEWQEARIPGAIHVALGELDARADELPRDRTIIVQCRSGNRSYMGALTLLSKGFRDVRNLEGGIVDWAGAELPVDARGVPE